MTIRKGRFRLSDLRKVADAPPPDDPPLRIGDRCQLISGSPVLLVVDLDGEGDDDSLTVSWKDAAGKAVEDKLPRGVLRRWGRRAA